MATFHFYTNYKLALGNKQHDMENDEFCLVLCTSTYTPDADADVEYADISNELATNYGYVSGGEIITAQTWTLDSGVVTFDGDDIIWTAVGGAIGPARYGVIFNNTHPDKLLVGYIDFSSNKTAGEGAEFKIEFPSTGIFKLQ